MAVERITQVARLEGSAIVGELLPRQIGTAVPGRSQGSLPAYVVELSPESRALSLNSRDDGAFASDGVTDNKGAVGAGECQTCKNRRYQDRSNDATVSFQAPTRLAPGAAEGAVRAHEQEHVSNEQARAAEEGRRVVSQTVSIQYAICPECGRSYVAGGTTTTVTKSELQPGASQQPPVANAAANGRVDLTV